MKPVQMGANSKIFEFIARAAIALRSSPSSSDAEIHRMLVTDGMDSAVAARLVEFLPMAYSRLLLEGSGARFSGAFQRRLPNGGVTEKRILSSEPTWNAVVEFSRNEAERGVSRADLILVAGRSAEFNAANQLLNKGAKLRELVFTPVVFPWPESGPEGEN
jgi:hypothetical protein